MMIRILEVLICTLSVCPIAFVHGQHDIASKIMDIEVDTHYERKRKHARSSFLQIGNRSAPNFGSRKPVEVEGTLDLVQAVESTGNRELGDFDEGSFWDTYLGGKANSMPSKKPTATATPSYFPSPAPSYSPTKSSVKPTEKPTEKPTTAKPTGELTAPPTNGPTNKPTDVSPSTLAPSSPPVDPPTEPPTCKPICK